MLNIIKSIIVNRQLVIEMAKRDLKMINKGAFLGYFWLVLSPLVQTGAYVLIVSFIFGTRNDSVSGPMDYALYVLGGMIPWQIMTKALAEAPTQLYSRMELVKQVIYPIETLPMTSLIVSSFGTLVSFFIFFILSVLTGGATWGILLIPVPFLFLLLFILGVSWIFSIVGVFFKDLREMVTIILGLLVYLSPVVASPSIVGDRVWSYMLLNPLSHIVICFRDIYYCEFSPLSWFVFVGISIFSFIIGSLSISKAKMIINQYV